MRSNRTISLLAAMPLLLCNAAWSAELQTNIGSMSRTAHVASTLRSAAVAKADTLSLHRVLVSALSGTRAPALGAVVIRHGKIISIAVYGRGRRSVRLNDLWMIGSCAKPMTSAMIVRLVDRRTLSWHTPLSVMLPNLAAKMRPEYRSVTLVELLGHRADLPHDVRDTNFGNAFYDDKRPLAQ